MASQTQSVSVGEYFNTPQVVTISAGDTVRWVNGGEQSHNVRSGTDPMEDGAWGSADFGPGASYSRTFDTPGSYPYFCSIHPLLMPGTVVVQP